MTKYLVGMIFCSLILLCCRSGQRLVRTTHPAGVDSTKRLVSRYNSGWLEYNVYELPYPVPNKNRAGQWEMLLSIAIVNKRDNVSPLRTLCRNLEDYNRLYEYLLNQSKADLYLVVGNETLYPVFYSFENNYNVFPFETLNVGYRKEGRRRRRSQPEKATLFFIDRVFSKDTLIFPLQQPNA